MTTDNLNYTMKGRLIHHYRVESLLGEGGMGTVYQAVDTHLERPVAIKMLHTHLVNQVSFMERFRNEALILARLNHPNIAVVYNFLQDGTDYFMAMEYVEGDSLETLIRRSGAMPVAVATEITRQGLEGLAHAHRKGIFHRDIKPANLMLTPEGSIKLMDFGIARVVGEQRLTQVNRIVGTLEYMAPELIQGESPSPASDIYAMGILLYELLSGKLPFNSQTDYTLMQAIISEKPTALRKLNSTIPKELEAIVQKALEKNPTKRFSSAKEFQKALQPFLVPNLTLDPTQFSTPQRTTDVLNIQPIRQTILAETRATNSPITPERIKPVIHWLSSNWQTVLAGGLTLLAIFFISLILFDKRPQMPTDEVTLTNTTKPKPEINTKIEQTAKPVESVVAHNVPTNTPTTSPKQPTNKPVDNQPVSTPKASTPATPKNHVTPSNPKPIQQAPVSTQENQPQRQEPTPTETIVHTVPKPTTRKSVTIRRLAVNLTLIDALSSDAAREGQSIRFRVTEPVVSEGEIVVAAGATAYGEVSRVKQAGDDLFRKKNLLEFRIQSVEAINGQRLPLRSATISEEAKGKPVLFRSGQSFEVRTGDGTITL